MKAKKKISILLLLATLLFGQVAVNFLHSIHNEHTAAKILPAGQEGVSQHGEHCQVCSVDFVHGFLNQEVIELADQEFTETCYTPVNIERKSISASFTQGRAPPASV